MNEPPVEVPRGTMQCFVVGARPADAVYPGRHDRRDLTLQVLLFSGKPHKRTFKKAIHLNVATGPFVWNRKRNGFVGDRELDFVRALISDDAGTIPEGTLEASRAKPRYIRREALQRHAFSARFTIVPGSYRRVIPVDGTVRRHNRDVDWPSIFSIARTDGVFVAGGANLRQLEFVKGTGSRRAWVNGLDNLVDLEPVDVLTWAQDGPLLLVDPLHQQLAVVPALEPAVTKLEVDLTGRKPGARVLAEDEELYGTAWLSTLIASMLNKADLLPSHLCSLEPAIELSESGYRQRVKDIQARLGEYGDLLIAKGRGGRGKRSVGRIHPRARCIVFHDLALARMLTASGAIKRWGDASEESRRKSKQRAARLRLRALKRRQRK